MSFLECDVRAAIARYGVQPIALVSPRTYNRDLIDAIKGLQMSLYLLLYSGGRMPETEEETETMMDAWGEWFAGIGDALADGNPFTANAKSLSPDGALSDGPVGPMASGYSLIKAESMDEAVEMARDCPAKLSGASISIFEVR